MGKRGRRSSKSSHHLVPFLQDGDRVRVYWPIMKKSYAGYVYKQSTGEYRVVYDDGDVEVLNMEKENWMFCDEAADRVAAMILLEIKKDRCLKNKENVEKSVKWENKW